MFVINNKKKIFINPDGSIKIGEKVYYDVNNNLRNINNITPLLDNNSSIEYLDIPIGFRKKINKSLNEIFENLESNEDGIIALTHLRDFGILKETRDILKESSKRINSSLFKMGFSNLDKFYFENKKAKLEFLENLNTNTKVNYSAITKYVSYYKDNNLNNFKIFCETLQDFGLKNQSDILKYYNDSIDSNFKLGSEEFGIISFAKRDLINLQNKIIQDAISLGLDVPIDLPRFIAPTDKIKDEVINPAKIKLLQTFDFSNINSYKNKYFNDDHSLSTELKTKFINDLKVQEKIINIDSNDNLDLIKLQVLHNNGFSFSKMKDWALNNKTEILGPQKSMVIAQSALKYCNKLVECGILQTKNFEDYTFTSPLSREILLENQSKSFNELAEIMIMEFQIKDTENGSIENAISADVIIKQKKEFYEFLDAQFASFYKTQNIDFENFKNDILKENSEEFNRMKDLYPALNGTPFIELIQEYEDKKAYIFDRTSTLNFKSKEIKDALNSKWQEIQNKNRNKSEDDLLTPIEFINISAVRFEGINLHKLNEWKDSVSLPGDQAEKFVELSIKHAKDLVNIGIFKTTDNEIFTFSDNYAKEILFKNYDKDLNQLEKQNLGTKKLNIEFSKKTVTPLEKEKNKPKLTSFTHNGINWELSLGSTKESYKIFRNGHLFKDNLTLLEVFSEDELKSDNFSTNKKELEKSFLEKYVNKILLQEIKLTDLSNSNELDKLNNSTNINSDELLKKFLVFNHYFEKSSNESYIKLMTKEEQNLINEIENMALRNPDFINQLVQLSISDIDANKYFHLTNILDSLQNKEYINSLNNETQNLQVN